MNRSKNAQCRRLKSCILPFVRYNKVWDPTYSMRFKNEIADPTAWSSEEISALWQLMDQLREKSKAEGWEDEFLSNVREWVDSCGQFPIEWLKLRRKDWKL